MKDFRLGVYVNQSIGKKCKNFFLALKEKLFGKDESKVDPSYECVGESDDCSYDKTEENSSSTPECDDDTVEETVFDSPKNEKPENTAVGVRKFFIHFFDLAASLVFIFAVIIAIKPELLTGVSFDRSVAQASQVIGGVFFQLRTIEEVPLVLIPIRNFCVSVSLFIFLFLKIVVVLLVKGQKKLVAFIMLALTIISCWLTADKFLLFLCFCVLLNIGFQVLCDFGGKMIKVEFLVLIIATIILYVILHIVGLDFVQTVLKCIGLKFKDIFFLFVKLIPQFTLPVFWW